MKHIVGPYEVAKVWLETKAFDNTKHKLAATCSTSLSPRSTINCWAGKLG